MGLVERWEVEELREHAQELAQSKSVADSLRLAAVRAVGSLEGPNATEILAAIADEKESKHQVAAVVAMIKGDIHQAAKLAAKVMWRSTKDSEISTLLSSFVSREKGGRLLAEALDEVKLDRSRGERLRASWIASGLVHDDLANTLDELAGVSATELKFNDRLVDQLVAQGKRGNASRGKELFHSAALGCVACHKVGQSGGIIGPDLSAVGSGVPQERIVTEVVWPAKQVKEGYSLSRVTLKDGRVLQGYQQQAQTKEVLVLRDFTTEGRERFARREVAQVEALGSLMPPTAQTLKRNELADLLSYLFGLNGQ